MARLHSRSVKDSTKAFLAEIVNRGLALRKYRKRVLDGTYSILPIVLLIAGTVLRVKQYLGNRSLWLDEAMLAQSIVHRGFLDLLRPLDNNQVAPPIYLMLVRAATVFLGPSEFGLRAVPLIASLAGLLLFYLLAKRFLDRQFLFIAVFMFSFSLPLIYYSQEAKQYSVDVAVAIALAYGFLRLVSSGIGRRRCLLGLAVVGIICPWASYSAAFVMVGILASLMLMAFVGKPVVSRVEMCLVGLGWLTSTGLCYMFALKHGGNNSDTVEFWANLGGFLPLPTSMKTARVVYQSLITQVHYSGFSLSAAALVIILVSIAVVEAVRTPGAMEIALFAPVLLTMGSSMLGKYPFQGRLTLFLLPFAFLLCVKGLAVLVFGRRPYILTIAAVLLLLPFLYSGYSMWMNQITKEEVRPLLVRLRERKRPGEAVYCTCAGRHAARYYQGLLDIDDSEWLYGPCSKDQAAKLPQILKDARSPRIWFLFSHVTGEEERSVLANIGATEVEKHVASGASLYLYQVPYGDVRTENPESYGNSGPLRQPY